MAKPVLSAPRFHNEEAAFAFIEEWLWPNGPVCPHCGNIDAARIGRIQGRIGLRKCYARRKTLLCRSELSLRIAIFRYIFGCRQSILFVKARRVLGRR